MKRHFGGVYRTVRKVTVNPGLVLPRKRPLPSAPQIDGQRFAFIAGLHRSGTSILHRLLREHPDASGFANTRVPEDEGQFLQTVFERDTVYGGPGRVAFAPDAHLTETSPLVTEANREKLIREWGPYFDLKKSVLLEKTPSNLIRSRFLQALFPGCRFVFIVRHPIPVGLSTYNWTRRNGIGLAEVMKHWVRAHEIFLDDLGHVENWTLVRYEDLVADPAPVLASIYQFLGLPPVEPNEGVGRLNGKYFDRWRSSVADKDEIAQDLSAEPSGQVLRTFGYRLSEPYITEPAFAARFDGLQQAEPMSATA